MCLRENIKSLHPAYFAMVMSTGIISIASHLMGMDFLARLLFWLNIAAFVILWAMTLARLVLYSNELYLDLIDHNRGVGFFTIVAGTCVLGSQFAITSGSYRIATALWVSGIVLWVGFTYAIFTALTVKEQKPALEKGIHGGWLVAVVATQSVSILGELVLQQFAPFEEWIHLFSLSLWLFGGMLYIWIISLIFYRYTFFKFIPSDLMPPYWINMGAMAISTLSGAILIINANKSVFLRELIPFLKGFTIFFWATATWWIPMLIILGVWRHVYKKFELSYNPLYWGAVFPLGMYTVATYQLAKALNLPFLMSIPQYFIYVALAAWFATFAGLVCHLLKLRENRGSHTA